MQAPNLKIVPDTNFYIAAILKDGYARSYLLGHGSKFLTYQLFASEEILLEVRDKLENKFLFERPQSVNVVQQIRKVVRVAYPTHKLQIVRDPADNKVLECALEVMAEVVVTFDKDLLSLKEFEMIKIIHPSGLKYLFPA